MPDRAALVTGASSGVGLAIADVLGAEGYGMTVAARRPATKAAVVGWTQAMNQELNGESVKSGGGDLRPISAIKRSHVRSQWQYI